MKTLYPFFIIFLLCGCGWGERPRLGIKKGKIVDLNQKLVISYDSLNKLK